MSAPSHAATQVNSNKKGAQPQQNGSGAGAVAVSGSTGSTPNAQTPNGNMAPQQQQVPPPSQSTSPPATNAPKYGTLVPNRVFVGGISANTTEGELAQLFSAYGTVKATKIISDRAGVSKGYGFVTFESEEEARRLQRESDNIMLRERRLNIAPAIKKQPFNRSFDVPSPPPNAATPAQYFYATAAAAAAPYAAAYQNGMAYYATPSQTTANGADHNSAAQQPVYQAPPVYATPTAAAPPAPYPMQMYPPQPLFVHQQYPYQPIPYDPQQFYGAGGQSLGAGAQYLYGFNGGGCNGGGGAVVAGGHSHSQQQSNGGNNATHGGSNGLNSNGGTASPSRHHHQQQHAPPSHHASYYQQIAYNATDAMYYNLPVYAIDPTGIYPEGLEHLTPALTEMIQTSQPLSIMDSLIGPPAILSTSVTPPGGQLQPTGALPKHNTPQHLGQHQKYDSSFVPVNERNGYNSAQQNSDKTSTTPVVSLLNVGPSNERDYRSMQGGRKYRSDKQHQDSFKHQQEPFKQHVDTFKQHVDSYKHQDSFKQHLDLYKNQESTSAVYTNSNNTNNMNGGIQSFKIAGPPVSYNMYQPMNGYLTNKVYRKTDKCDSNQCRSWSKKRRNYICNTESSSRSSVRTSSNSSANAVFDENLNERKDKTNDFSPPPTAYSPMTFQNSHFPHDPTYQSRNMFQAHPTTYNSYHHQNHQGGGGITNARGRNRRNNARRNNNNHHSHGPANITVTSQQYHQSQHHQRDREHPRDRDQQRDQSQQQNQVEIGAGDAPLPTEVNDLCKKIDSIKL